MGRKYHYNRKHMHRGGGSGLASLLFSALSGRRSHSGYSYRSRSVKSSLVNALARTLLKKIFR